MSDVMQFLLKIHDEEKKQAKENLPNWVWFKRIGILSIILIIISWIFSVSNREFVSNLLLNLSAGCTTGLVLYLLTNLRSRQLSKTEQIYALAVKVRKLYKPLANIFAFLDPMIYPKHYQMITGENREFKELYENALDKLSKFLKTAFKLTTFLDTPADNETKEKIDIIRMKIRNARNFEQINENDTDDKRTQTIYKKQLKDLADIVKDIRNFVSEIERSKKYELDHLKNRLF